MLILQNKFLKRPFPVQTDHPVALSGALGCVALQSWFFAAIPTLIAAQNPRVVPGRQEVMETRFWVRKLGSNLQFIKGRVKSID